MAQPLRTAPPSPAAGAQPVAAGNNGCVVSAAGRQAIQDREGVRHHPYDTDGSHNCTVGVGQLLHHGLCTAAERHRQVSDTQIQRTMDGEVNRFTTVVRQGVPTRTLTQNQFDALVSFAYNAPHTETDRVLRAAELAHDENVMRLMNATVNVHAPGSHGRRGPLTSSPGLIRRRGGEVAQYLRPDQP